MPDTDTPALEEERRKGLYRFFPPLLFSPDPLFPLIWFLCVCGWVGVRVCVDVSVGVRVDVEKVLDNT